MLSVAGDPPWMTRRGEDAKIDEEADVMGSTSSETETVRALLREAGLRATPARVAVLEVLREVSAPVSHSDVVTRLEGRGWDPATVFRNLVALVDAGFIRRIDMGDHVWRFEAITRALASDPTLHEHPHFLCTECGEVSCMPAFELKLPRSRQIPQSVRARAVHIQLQGVCDDCA